VQIQTRSDYEAFVAHLFHLSASIGIRPAARALGISEERAKKIAQRRKFGISKIRRTDTNPHPKALSVPTSPQAIEATQRVIEHYGNRAKIGATIAGAKALEHLADSTGAELVKPAAAISGDQWTKAVDRAAGWTAARQNPVQVAVQVNLPTAEETAERKARHARLDEIAALLRDKGK